MQQTNGEGWYTVKDSLTLHSWLSRPSICLFFLFVLSAFRVYLPCLVFTVVHTTFKIKESDQISMVTPSNILHVVASYEHNLYHCHNFV